MASTREVIEIVTTGHADPGTEPRVKPFVNVYTFSRTNLAVTAVKANILTAFKAAILDVLKLSQSVAYIADWIDIRFLDDETDPYLRQALTIDGTVAGDSLPSTMNVTVQLKTGLRGRNYRGSKHYGPISEADTVLDNLDAAAIVQFDLFAAALLAGFTDSDGILWSPWLCSRTLSYTGPMTAILVGQPITQVLVNPTLGTMRRRSQARN